MDELDTTAWLANAEAQAKGEREEMYSQWARQYRAGQMSSEQWNQHMKNPDFVDWLGDL